jgi:hypothetical protein
MLSVALGLMSGAAAPARSPSGARYLPLKIGNTWVYRGTVRADVGGGVVLEAEIEVRSRVVHVRTLSRSASLAWVTRSFRILHSTLSRGDARRALASILPPFAYFVDGSRVYQASTRYGDEGSPLREVTDDHHAEGLTLRQVRHLFRQYGDIQFTFPLHDGKRFANAGQKLREDGHYQWVVASREPVMISGKRYREVYRLTNRSLNAALKVDFVPGIGVTRETSAHFAGSLHDWNLELVRFHLG